MANQSGPQDRDRVKPRVVSWRPRGTEMRPVSAASQWHVPEIRTPRELAAWLNVSFKQLDWLADIRSLEYTPGRGRSRHYCYRVLSKRFGAVRLIEAPKSRLKAIQRQISSEILSQIPVHESVHGFRRGKSINTFAAPHVGRACVTKIDLEDFFPTVTRSWVRGIFQSAGYPDAVSVLLAGLCTNSAPHDVWQDMREQLPRQRLRYIEALYATPHLPQGAPSSPTLANLAAFRLDCRLSGLARKMELTYTRYADDLAFSSDSPATRDIHRRLPYIYAIVMEEGFRIHFRKTRVMPSAGRQFLTGLVVNDRLNITRTDYDVLKAILTNCVRHGPDGQNRDRRNDFRAHLSGRIAFVESVHPERGNKLRQLFERIQWPT
ncbi:MAG: reverse transcriptase family protein [Pirellulaceae bacterium]|nr:RNA-directed DNA polymerase [Planctomycetales bacterium]